MAPFRRFLFVLGFVLVHAATGSAQEAAVAGVITDTTGAVLPGVVVRAVHETSGNSFETVTDSNGAYRLPIRTGVYRITAELPGFSTQARGGLEVLVGREVAVNLEMAPSALQESVTVTGEAPLIETTQSSLGGNIDPRQMQDLPLNGRNWMDLTLLAPGSRANAVATDDPVRGSGSYQINVDGQQVTNVIQTGFGQPRYSRDAVAEFEFISNRFDATQGRSSGVQINAVTKSGTNTFSGTASSYFRHDSMIAKDFVARRVLPYSNQQLGLTFGGPVRRDRIHFFGYYEYEREPRTFIYESPYPRFNIDLTDARLEHKGGGRADFQFSSQLRLAVRANVYDNLLPHDPRWSGGAIRHPAGANNTDQESKQVFGSLTQILGNRALNEIRVGYGGYGFTNHPPAKWPASPSGLGIGAPSILLIGYTVGQNHVFSPQTLTQHTYSVRDDFTYSFAGKGRHTLKLGGEYAHHWTDVFFCNLCNGQLDARGGPVPANLEDLFPVWDDVSTWNLAPLSPISVRWRQNFGTFAFNDPRRIGAFWLQDDWSVTSRLTLNLGMRYDVMVGSLAEHVIVEPFLPEERPSDRNNIAPRIGFAYSLNDRTVIRGGFGKYFGDVVESWTQRTSAGALMAGAEVPYDGRADFASNPFNGPPPTFDQILRSGVRRENTLGIISPTAETPYSYQTSIGTQRQLGGNTAIEADYVYSANRHEPAMSNINLSYNPATGVNYPFTDVSRRPFPQWGVVNLIRTEGRAESHALQTAFTKRFANRWQASATYTLSGSWSRDDQPLSGFEPVPFTVAADLGGERSLAAGDQRHRAVVSGIWQVGYGFQVGGLYFYGSGERISTSYGTDLRNTGGTGTNRLRPDGTIVPRNVFVGMPLHRVDMRVQRQFALGSTATVAGIVELFNVFNHANYGSYTTQETNRQYGLPTQNTNVAYQPRMLQLGVRVAF